MQIRVVAADENPRALAVRRFRVVRAAEDFVAGFVLPFQRAGRGVERVEKGVGGADENGTGEHEWRGLDAGGGFESPLLLAGRGVERVDLAAVIAEEDATARNRRRAFHGLVALELPEQLGFHRRGHLREAAQLRPAAVHRPVGGVGEKREQNREEGRCEIRGARASRVLARASRREHRVGGIARQARVPRRGRTLQFAAGRRERHAGRVLHPEPRSARPHSPSASA